jgi:hypothetical protein
MLGRILIGIAVSAGVAVAGGLLFLILYAWMVGSNLRGRSEMALFGGGMLVIAALVIAGLVLTWRRVLH